MRRWVDSGRLPGCSSPSCATIASPGSRPAGYRDVESGRAVEPDTVYRIYSMTKPITTVAALMLYEEGRFQLDDPIAQYIPAFAETKVFASGDAESFTTVPLARPITVHDLMIHTSGLTYGFLARARRRCALSPDAGSSSTPTSDRSPRWWRRPPPSPWCFSRERAGTTASPPMCSACARRDLVRRPPRYLLRRTHLRARSACADTGFQVPEGQGDRLASNYVQANDGGLAPADPAGESRFLQPAVTLSGGGGLVSTAADYLRFLRMLRSHGSLDGARLLGRKSVELMTTNHLPGDLADMGRPRFAEMPFAGIGFGLGGVGDARSGQSPDPRLARRVRMGAAWRAPRSGSIRPKT